MNEEEKPMGVFDTWSKGEVEDVDTGSLRRLVKAHSEGIERLTCKENRSLQDEVAILRLVLGQLQTELALSTTLLLKRLNRIEKKLDNQIR